jgi:hypothetical protein
MTEPILDARDIYARAQDQWSPDGRPPVGNIRNWGNFPYSGEISVTQLDQPVLPEPPRGGVEAADCPVCRKPDEDYLWTSDHWRLRGSDTAQALPTYFLEPRGHLDLGELSDELAAELGVLVVRVERAIASVEGVGRVHVDRWGDGLHHLHMFVYARPAGMLQLKGLFMPVWMDALPALPRDTAEAIDQRVADLLAAFDAPEGSRSG